MAEEKETYDLTPLETDAVRPPVVPPPGPAGPAPGPAAPGIAPGAPAPGPAGKPGGLLDDFDEDADFTKDPEVERALKGVRGLLVGEARPGDTRPLFVRPGFGPAQVWLLVGAALLVGAVVGASINATRLPVVVALLVVYAACLHTVTGVAAVSIGAMLTQSRVGSVPLAGARMFAAVTAFLVVANLRITLLGGPHLAWEELTLATLAYVGMVAMLFRIWGRALAYVVCSHFLLWIVVQIGMSLSAWVSSAPTVPPTPAS